MKKYYTTYETINTINNKYYIGFHTTSNLYDNYYGSGKLLKKAIHKYGSNKFIKIINGVWKSKQIMKLMESWMVDKEVVSDSKSYNLKLGGEGGWDHLSPEKILESSLLGVKKLKELYPEGNQKSRVIGVDEKMMRRNAWNSDLRGKLSVTLKQQFKDGRISHTKGKFGMESVRGQIIKIFDNFDNLIDTYYGDFSTRGRIEQPAWSSLRSSKMHYNKTGRIKKINSKLDILKKYNGWYSINLTRKYTKCL